MADSKTCKHCGELETAHHIERDLTCGSFESEVESEGQEATDHTALEAEHETHQENV